MKKLYLAFFLLIGLSGCEQSIDPTAKIAANSCDADDVCEVAKTISTRKGSSSALRLMSDAGPVNVEGPLAAESLIAGRVSIDGKIISTTAGSTSALVLASDVGFVIVEGDLSIPKLRGKGNAYACLGTNGNLFRSDVPCK